MPPPHTKHRPSGAPSAGPKTSGVAPRTSSSTDPPESFAPTSVPGVCTLTDDESLRSFVAKQCSELGLRTTDDVESSVLVVDASVGLASIRGSVSKASAVAVVRSAGVASAVLLALRLSRGVLIEDPRKSLEGFRAFLADALLLEGSRRDRRLYPRAQGSGVRVTSPDHAEVVDISPYGLRIRLPRLQSDPVTFRVRIQFEQRGLSDDVQCQVVEHMQSEAESELRLRFVALSPESQQELFRIAKAEVFCKTIVDTHAQCENGEVDGYRRVLDVRRIVEIVRQLAEEHAELRLGRLSRGRPLVGKVVVADAAKRLIECAFQSGEGLDEVGDRICYSAAGTHGTWLMDGHVVSIAPGAATITFPSACIAAELRAQDRLFLGLNSPLRVQVFGRQFPVSDISARGFSFVVPDGVSWATPASRLDVNFTMEDGIVLSEAVLVRNARSSAAGVMVGCTFGEVRSSSQAPLPPLVEDERDASFSIAYVDGHFRSEKVSFLSSAGRRVVGLWTQNRTKGPSWVLVVPPAWAKTKESMALLAQFFCATFEASGAEVAVLRIDYTDALGESERGPEFQNAGHETLGLTLSGCVSDIHGAIEYAKERHPHADVALVGMSFSGPLALRAAVSDTRVSVLFELMGASDIQDLVRRATGGVDYVNRYRAGMRTGLQNVLGILSDTDRWVADGIRSELVYLQSTQADAARLESPLLWIHGRHDAFVSEERIRSVLDFAGAAERRLVLVPCGHVPTKTNEAILSYVPIAEYLLARSGLPMLARSPRDEVMARVSEREWAEAPRSGLASPKDYWREYMLGNTDASLGFDVLTMTREYRELMRLQAALLELDAGASVHDVGGGLGHSLGYLRHDAQVTLYDLVPELLEQARTRAKEGGRTVDIVPWDADSAPPPASLSQATHVLMSLFLSVLSNPDRFLEGLVAVLRPGARVVASSMLPDADLSTVYTGLLHDVEVGALAPPAGYGREELVEAIREYMNSAAWLLRLADEGTFHFYGEAELKAMFTTAGLRVRSAHRTFGSPERAIVIVGEKA